MSSCCVPTCAVPACPKECCPSSCCSKPCSCPPCYPVGGIGKLSCSPSSCCISSSCGKSVPAECLGKTSGAEFSCMNQMPPSECWLKGPSTTIVFPGMVMTSTGEPMKATGYTACAGPPPCGCVSGCPC